MRIAIIGTGYVGLVTGVCLAHLGHEVVCVDLDTAKVDDINNGRTPIHEDGLTPLLEEVVGHRFSATSDLADAVRRSEITILAVGTPFGEGRIDLRQIEVAARDVGAALRGRSDYHVVAVKSTVVPGTTAETVGPALEAASGRQLGPTLGLAMNPEFLREGSAVVDFLEPDRIVIGGIDDRSIDRLAAVYDVFDGVPIVRADTRTAEMVKYTSNALLALLISFSNEVGNLSAALGVDVREMLGGVHLDRRLSPVLDGERISPGILTYLAAGAGFGGSCFPKDVRALVAHGEQLGIPMPILGAALAVNEQQADRLTELVSRQIEPAGAHITVLGAAFKPGTDDVRESPALRVVQTLMAAGAKVTVHDPVALPNMTRALPDVGIVCEPDLVSALSDADAVVIVTAWSEYQALPELLHGRDIPVIDGRRVIDPGAVARYAGIGYPEGTAYGETSSGPGSSA